MLRSHLLATVLILPVIFGCGDGAFSGLGGDKGESNKSEPKKPSEEGEGVPGYLTDPKLISILEKDGKITLKGSPGAVSGYDSDPTGVSILVWDVEPTEFAKLIPNEGKVIIAGSLIGITVATSDGSFEVDIVRDPRRSLVISTDGETDIGPIFDSSDETKLTGVVIAAAVTDPPFGLGLGSFVQGTDVPGSHKSRVLSLWRNATGDHDLVRLTSDRRLVIQSIDGQGAISEAVEIAAFTAEAQALAIGDFNGDGSRDIAVGIDGQGLQIFLAEGSAFLGQAPLNSTNDYERLFLVDVNNDSHLDIVALAAVDQSNLLYLGLGDGTFSQSIAIHDPLPKASLSAASGDFNGDGHVDLAIGPWSEDINLLFGDGKGAFAEDKTLPLSSEKVSHEIVAVDFDRDGDLDLFVACKNDNFVFFNDGSGGFTRSEGIGQVRNSFAAGAGDFNGDGWPDIVVKNHQSPSQVFLNRGAGIFDEGFDLGTEALSGTYGGNLVISDINHDRILDIIFSNPGSAPSDRIYLGE